MRVHNVAACALMLLLSVAAATSAQVAAQGTDSAPVPVSELVERAKDLDGQDIVIQGEVLEDVMRRGEYVWLNLLGDGVAVGVWAREDDLPRIGYRGSYWARGDVLRVEGNFHRACPDHGGELDLHATSVMVVKKGTPVPVKAGKGRTMAALGLSLAGVLLVVLWRRREGEATNS